MAEKISDLKRIFGEDPSRVNNPAFVAIRRAAEDRTDSLMPPVLEGVEKLQDRITKVLAKGDYTIKYVGDLVDKELGEIDTDYRAAYGTKVTAAERLIEKAQSEWDNRDRKNPTEELLRLQRAQFRFQAMTATELSQEAQIYAGAQPHELADMELNADELNILATELKKMGDTAMFNSFKTAIGSLNINEPWRNREDVQAAQAMVRFYEDIPSGMIKVRLGEEEGQHMLFTLQDLIHYVKPLTDRAVPAFSPSR